MLLEFMLLQDKIFWISFSSIFRLCHLKTHNYLCVCLCVYVPLYFIHFFFFFFVLFWKCYFHNLLNSSILRQLLILLPFQPYPSNHLNDDDHLVVYNPFNIIYVILRQWKDDNERLSTMKHHTFKSWIQIEIRQFLKEQSDQSLHCLSPSQ